MSKTHEAMRLELFAKQVASNPNVTMSDAVLLGYQFATMAHHKEMQTSGARAVRAIINKLKDVSAMIFEEQYENKYSGRPAHYQWAEWIQQNFSEQLNSAEGKPNEQKPSN